MIRKRMIMTGPTTKYSLTPKQLEVLDGAAIGEQSKETALRTGRSVETIKRHRADAIRELRARNIVHAVAIAIRKELI
jgi:DNA-binding CsgD family transcriptional regulator